MLFRRASVRYGRTPEPETPFQKAAQVWDERIGSARVQARNWRLIAFGTLLLAAGLAGGLVWQAARGTVTPWVVEIDKLGQAQAVAPAVADYRPTDPQIAWHLARFIEHVRSIPADPSSCARDWLAAYDFVTDKGRSRSTTMPAPTIPSQRSARPRSRSRSRASSAPPTTASASPGSSAATRTRPRRDRALDRHPHRRAHTPNDAERLRKNPLGVFVHAINWSKELG